MNEIYRQLLVILHAMWQRRWYALATAWAVTLVGWGVVATIPDRYNSYARIYVDTDTMLQPLMQGLAVEVNVFRQIAMMQRTLLSRPNLEKVVRMTDMDLTVGSEREMDELLTSLGNEISISSQGANLFRVSYQHEEPQMAQRVVQSLLTLFVEGNLGASRTDLASAQRFIDEQLRAYEKQMEQIEKERSDFRREHGGLFLKDGDYHGALQKAQTSLEELEKKRREVLIARQQLARQFESVPRYLKLTTPTGPSAAAPSGSPSNLFGRIAQLEENINQLKMRGYTDRHPDVVVLQRMLDAAEEELTVQQEAAEEDGETVDGLRANTTVVNPVYDQIQIKIIDADSHVATLDARIAEQKAEISRLEEAANVMPSVEAERMRLVRDYKVIREKYEELLARRESARLAQDLETKSDKVQFRVIDPPEVPLTPSSPNRPMYLTMALVLGLGAGVAVAFVFSQLHTTFASAERLRSSFNLPVLGTISTVISAADRRQQRLRNAMFSAVTAGLFIAFAGLMAVEAFIRPGIL